MNRHTSVVTKDQLVEQFNAVVTEAEQLLKSVATAGDEKVGGFRASAEQSLTKAMERLRELQHAATDKVEAASKTTDVYVHEHPWRTIGVAAGAAVVAGMAIGLLMNRH